MFESKKALNLLAEKGHQGHAEPSIYIQKIKACTFSVNNFQICFIPSTDLIEDELVIIEQLLRFEEVLTLSDWENLSFREFESFLRDKNSSPSVYGVNFQKVNDHYNTWKNILSNIIRVRKGLDILKQKVGSVEKCTFIEACVKINHGFSDLHKECVFKENHFYKIYEFNALKSEIIFEIETKFAVNNFEIELLRLFGKSIEGVKSVKMVARQG
tara:strand:- start:1083 stop:1724 length:642 start_codon:yes stop_codon:yes gene_type:complete